MKSKENLVFLGMMGSGKSSIGSLAAKKLKLNFVDIDKEIENCFCYTFTCIKLEFRRQCDMVSTNFLSYRILFCRVTDEPKM